MLFELYWRWFFDAEYWQIKCIFKYFRSLYFLNDKNSEICLTIAKGEHVGIVGRTGSGKSSLFAALYHLSDSMTGEISIHGRNKSNCSVSSLRRSLSLIPQDPTLFSKGLQFFWNFKIINQICIESEIAEKIVYSPCSGDPAV